MGTFVKAVSFPLWCSTTAPSPRTSSKRCEREAEKKKADRDKEGKGREGEMWEDSEAEIRIISMQTLLKKGAVLFSVRVHACTYSIHVHLH